MIRKKYKKVIQNKMSEYLRITFTSYGIKELKKILDNLIAFNELIALSWKKCDVFKKKIYIIKIDNFIFRNTVIFGWNFSHL